MNKPRALRSVEEMNHHAHLSVTKESAPKKNYQSNEFYYQSLDEGNGKHCIVCGKEAKFIEHMTNDEHYSRPLCEKHQLKESKKAEPPKDTNRYVVRLTKPPKRIRNVQSRPFGRIASR